MIEFEVKSKLVLDLVDTPDEQEDLETDDEVDTEENKTEQERCSV
jgi:hypothetical protein